MTIALYPGSFDPVTHGHLNILQRGVLAFDRVIVGVAHNVRKKPLFTPKERVDMLKHAIGDDPRVEVVTFRGLLIDYATECQAEVILRGLRAVSDFEYEFQMAHMNRRLVPEIDTVFMMTGEEHFYVSSNLVREVARFGGDVSAFVPEHVKDMLWRKFHR